MEKEIEEWLKQHKFYRYNDYLTKELAEYLKVSPRTIQRWIKDKARPDRKKLNLIKKYLSEKAIETSKALKF